MTKFNLAAIQKGHKEVAFEYGVPWVMTSFYYHSAAPTDGSGEGWTMDYMDHPNCKGLIMDSGAFSFISSSDKMEKAEDHDWYEYARVYGEYVAEHDVERYIGLDLDSVIGYDEVLELRDYLEDVAGRPCIPVWHRNRGKEAWLEMCEKYDRVAMGGFPWDEIPPKKYHVLPWFIDTAHERDARVHALGFQPTTDQIEKYPFDSTDSANWMWNGLYGTLYKWNGRRMEEYPHEKKVTKEFYKHNLREWAKYSNYMDGKNEVSLPSGEW